MRISDIIVKSKPEAEAEPQPPLSAAHQALLDTLVGLLATVQNTSHPLIRIFDGILPSLAKDLARVPEADVRRFCRDFASKLSAIADAEEVTQ